MFADGTLLITGGTGSFGNASVRRFLSSDLKEIRIFSRDEKKQDDMRKHYADDRLSFYIGDVRDPASLKDAMRGVNFVFHAAALKQVPSCEFFPMEAVETNVIGTNNVLTAAIDAGVGRVVCLSTDKAAYPINAMGVSKAMMERVVVAKARNVHPSDTTISCTRYGNVMASRGSVIPLFIEQMQAGRPITITDPTMTRFLMNLDEAVDLVAFAFSNARQGDLFVQKASATTVANLAEALRQLFVPDAKIEIIGTRHGEKAHETLMTREELLKAEDLGSYYRVPSDNRDLNYREYTEAGDRSLSDAVEFNSLNTRQLSIEEVKSRLLETDYVQNAIAEMKGRGR